MALLDLQGMSARDTGADLCGSDVSVVLCSPWPCSQLSIVLCPQ